MNRRSFLGATGAAALPLPAALPSSGAAPVVETEIKRLKLRHTWTTVMSSSEFRDTIHVRIHKDGIRATGEGAPIVRYKESAQSAQKAIESVKDYLATNDLRHYHKVLAEVFRRIEGEWAAKSAIDIAVMDWVAQKAGMPLHQLFGCDAADAPLTTFSIGIDTPEKTREKVREAAPYPVLKIKVGLDSDEATINAVRAETKKPLRVDANEGWKTKEEAVEKIQWLETQGVELIEQPLPAARLADMDWIRQRVKIPVFADEACLQAADVAKVAPYCDGVNIKLDKCGGILEAYRMIQTARSLGLKVMVGCMVSSSLAITAAAHLAPLLDYADLDGNLLLREDPFTGVKVVDGRLVLPNKPGLGVTKA